MPEVTTNTWRKIMMLLMALMPPKGCHIRPAIDHNSERFGRKFLERLADVYASAIDATTHTQLPMHYVIIATLDSLTYGSFDTRRDSKRFIAESRRNNVMTIQEVMWPSNTESSPFNIENVQLLLDGNGGRLVSEGQLTVAVVLCLVAVLRGRTRSQTGCGKIPDWNLRHSSPANSNNEGPDVGSYTVKDFFGVILKRRQACFDHHLVEKIIKRSIRPLLDTKPTPVKPFPTWIERVRIFDEKEALENSTNSAARSLGPELATAAAAATPSSNEDSTQPFIEKDIQCSQLSRTDSQPLLGEESPTKRPRGQ